ncbi:MAG: metallophosphoesterase, partial [Coprobacillaceae bacterium]
EALHIDTSKYQILKIENVKNKMKELKRFTGLVSFFISLFIATVLGLVDRLLGIDLLSICLYLISGVGIFFLYKKYKKYKFIDSYFLDTNAKEYILNYMDLYKRKLLVAVTMFFSWIFLYSLYIIFVLGEIQTSSLYNTLVSFNLWSISIFIFLVIQNVIKLFFLRHFDDSENKIKYKRYSIKYIISNGVINICGFVFAIFALNQGYINSLFLPNIIIFIVSIFLLMIQRQDYLRKVVRINRVKKIILISICIFMYGSLTMNSESWTLESHVNSVKTLNTDLSNVEFDEDTGIYSMTMKDDAFKILQITDVHLGGSTLSYDKDIKALEAVYNLIDYTKPDFIMVTGDFVFPVGIFSYSFNNYAPIMQFANFMRNIGIPWAFVYGNHDTESMATHSADELNTMLSQYSYEENKSNLLYTRKQPDIMGRNNQIIQIKNSDGSINQVLYLLDSNDYTGEGFNEYDYIHDDQIKWYEESLESIQKENSDSISSLMFFHIPIEEYQEAYDLYKEDNPSIIYHFGKIGEENEAISTSGYENDLFEKIVSLNSTKAIFVGHDHYNNISLEYQGVRLTYGMSIDYLAMPGIYNRHEQRGATLITLKENSEFDIEQVPLQDIE